MGKIARVLTVLLLLFSIGLTGALAQDQDTGDLRFVHVIPGVSAVDVYIDGQLTVSNLGYGEASSYVSVPSGSRQITVRPSGLTTNLWNQTVGALSDQPQTLIASSLDPLEFVAFEDDFTPLGLGTARFKAVYAISNGGPVDILAGEDPVGSGLNPGDFAGTFDVPTSSYDLTVVPTGGTAEDSILPTQTYGLVGGTSQMLIIYGTPSIPAVMMLSTPTAATDDSGFVRLAHGVADAPAVDVYFDDELVVPVLGFGETTGHLAVPAGDYNVELRVSGETTVILEAALTVEAGVALTTVALGTPEDVEVAVFDDDISGIDAGTVFASVINVIPEGTISVTLADGTALADDLAFGETTGLITLDPITQDVRFTLTRDGETTTLSAERQKFYGGVYYNIIAVDGSAAAFTPPSLVVAPTSLAQSLASAPGAEQVTIVEAEELETEVVEAPEVEVVEEPVDDVPDVEDTEVVVVEPDPEIEEEPAPAQIQPPVITTPEPRFPSARVVLDPGANLHLREYPGSQARSLGLAPSGSVFRVFGREGAPVDLDGEEIPIETETGELIEWVDPVGLLEDDRDDLPAGETWLNIAYATPDGGEIVAWVNAQYLDVRDINNRPQRLADLDTVPGNRPGEARDTEITPPPVREDRVTVRIINLDSGVNLNIRRTPQSTGEVLARVPNGTVAEFVGLGESGDWVFIRLTPAEGGTITGWASTRFVEYLFNDRPIDLDELEMRGLLQEADEEEQRGAVGVGAPGVAQPTPDPTRDAYIAEVRINPDANLNLRRQPSPQAEVLERIPSGAQLIIEGRTEDAEWLLTEFENQTGWVASAFVVVTFNNAFVELEEIPVITIPTEEEEEEETEQ
jgi:uncharacterized protein YgiM (DUF1202 family)